MYESFYNFKEKPFSLTPDPKFLYFSKQHQGALDHMMYGIDQREGFIAIVGGIGTGKTTLSRCLLNRLGDEIKVALVLNPMLSALDLLRALLHDLGVRPLTTASSSENTEVLGPRRIDDEYDDMYSETLPEKVSSEPEFDLEWINHASKKELLDALNAFLLEQHAKGGSTVLIIDEAQNLDLDVMEQLRLLSNLETDKQKLLQIIFVGQKELQEKLQLDELKQLRQRISIQYELSPMTWEETRNYIQHRILIACGVSRIEFTKAAINETFSYSKGYPRLINLVCDRALLAGCNAQVDYIDAKHVRQGIRSLLGEEEKGFFLRRFIKEKLALVASLIFFIAGAVLFFLSENPGVTSGSKSKMASWLASGSVSVKKPTPQQQAALAQVMQTQSTPSPSATDSIPEPESTTTVSESPSSSTPVVEEAIQAPKKTEVSAVLPKSQDGLYRIQVHSTQKRNQALLMQEELMEEGYAAFIKEATSTGKSWYVVYVGPYKKLSQARLHVNSLKFSGRNPILLSINKAG